MGEAHRAIGEESPPKLPNHGPPSVCIDSVLSLGMAESGTTGTGEWIPPSGAFGMTLLCLFTAGLAWPLLAVDCGTDASRRRLMELPLPLPYREFGNRHWSVTTGERGIAPLRTGREVNDHPRERKLGLSLPTSFHIVTEPLFPLFTQGT